MTDKTNVPQTLLLADDSVTIQRVIELTFADEDIKVVAVSDGDQAITRINSDPPDIVLVDVGMPGRSGYEVAEHIKQAPALRHIPVLLLTGAFEPVDQEKAVAVGCDGVLAKPFEPQLVISRVKELLGQGGAASGPRHEEAAVSTEEATSEAFAKAWLISEAEPATAVESAAEAEPAAETPRSGRAERLDDYFAQLDAAFATLADAAPPEHVEQSEAPVFLDASDWLQAPPSKSTTSSDDLLFSSPAAAPPPELEVRPDQAAGPVVVDNSGAPLMAEPPPSPGHAEFVPPPPPGYAEFVAPPAPAAHGEFATPPVLAEPTAAPPRAEPTAAPPRAEPAAPPAWAAPAASPEWTEPVAPSRWAESAAPAPRAVTAAAPPREPVAPQREVSVAGSRAVALPPLVDAFAAILAAEQGEAAPDWPAAAGAGAAALTDEAVEDITRRVLGRLSDRVVRETVADVVSAVAERLVREEIERIKSTIK